MNTDYAWCGEILDLGNIRFWPGRRQMCSDDNNVESDIIGLCKKDYGGMQ